MKNKVVELLKPSLYNDIFTITKGGIDFSCFENKTVMITGAGTLVGYYITCALLISNDIDNTNINIIAVDRSTKLMETYRELTSRQDIEFVISNMCDNFGSLKADYVIHGDFFMYDHESNINMLEYIRKCNACAVMCSDMTIYGTVYNGKDEIFETDLGYIDCANLSYYDAQNHRMAECATIEYAKENNVDIKIARAGFLGGNVYGAPVSLDDPMYEELFSDKYELYPSSPTLLSSYCYVTDCARALLTILLKGKKLEAYNVASDNSITSCVDFHRNLSTLTGSNLIVKSHSRDTVSAMDPTQLILNTNKLKALGFVPRVGMENGLKLTVAIMKEKAEGGVE